MVTSFWLLIEIVLRDFGCVATAAVSVNICSKTRHKNCPSVEICLSLATIHVNNVIARARHRRARCIAFGLRYLPQRWMTLWPCLPANQIGARVSHPGEELVCARR